MLKKRDEIKKVGVYFLFDDQARSKANSLSREAEDCFGRLKQHTRQRFLECCYWE